MLSLAAWGLPVPSAWLLGAAVLVALAVDRWLGEPPVGWHPVVWMGNYLGGGGRWVQARTRQASDGTADHKAFWLGALVWIAGAALVLIAASGLQWGLAWLLRLVMASGQGSVACAGAWAGVAVVLGVLLKPLLAWAMLQGEVLAVERALQPEHGGSLAQGRERLRWLVSRDVAALSETEVRESAIETLAENLNDSVVAPLFWFVLLGLPGAALFRFANTADAMWGYRGVYQGRNWLWAGKWAARADDVLGWLPARLTALLLALVVRGGAGALSLARLRFEARRTPSPNSGWPMAAMALGLGVRLGKPGGYVLHDTGRAVTALDTDRAIAYASKSLLALVLIAQAAIISIAFWGVT
jgi:adenosylcobinamide-phosphate synthase